MQLLDILTAASAQSVDEFEGRHDAVRGGTDWLGERLTQFQLVWIAVRNGGREREREKRGGREEGVR